MHACADGSVQSRLGKNLTESEENVKVCLGKHTCDKCNFEIMSCLFLDLHLTVMDNSRTSETGLGSLRFAGVGWKGVWERGSLRGRMSRSPCYLET